MQTPALAVPSVLIVDDSVVQRNHCAELCRALGVARVLEAKDGLEALELLEGLEDPPELLIVDLEMPALDGPELIGRLQERKLDIPILVVSARERAILNSMRDFGNALGMRIIGTLQKPLSAQALEPLLNHQQDWAERRSAARMPIDAQALRAALERGEIGVHFEPQIDLRTAEVRGVEALARWRHPLLGWVPPDQFIPLAERHDLIHPLTLQVMQQAMLQASVWKGMGRDLTLSVNMSAVLLERPGLLEDITGTQQAYGLAPGRVTLEVTETGVVRELATALGLFTRLRLRGFGLSLDDYGTGFSSLQQLARIPFTELKIDRSFVRHCHERDKVRVVLQSALRLAGELGLTSVAEGVEHIDEWWLLKESACTRVQGWMFTRSLPALEFTQWLDAYRPQALTSRAHRRTDALRRAPAWGGQQRSHSG
ncbi:MAG TPA: EAL domain-containing response regulator [Steroidobacteraceae bacterium]|nr:EAL domain-containing response regulator [Steroidobacteraceae bacterium]